MNNVRLRTNETAVSGRVKGVYNKETKGFDIKREQTKNGDRYQVFKIQVSTKQKDGTYINGYDVPIILWGNTKVEANSIIGLVGKLEANNYIDKDTGKEVKGLQLKCNCTDMFTPLAWEKPEVEKEIEVEEW